MASFSTSRKFYRFSLFALSVGWMYLLFQSVWADRVTDAGFCLFKRLTSYPCPSCGSTRSVMLLLQGEFQAALISNPLGYILLAALLLGSLWFVFDSIFRTESLYRVFVLFESKYLNAYTALALFAVLMALWVWILSR